MYEVSSKRRSKTRGQVTIGIAFGFRSVDL